MQAEDQRLANHCQHLQQNTQQALQWLTANKELLGKEFDSLHAELRRAGRSFYKCQVAAQRKMCVGVFGPSQSGKSYLISTLARDSKGSLIANFSGEHHDFITEINPEGGKESTGLVTRFTTTAPENTPAGHPIRLGLLTECDVVRVLANTYYADCEHKESPDQEALLADMKSLEAHYSATHNNEVHGDDMEELREYMARNFSSRPRVQLLQRAYWQRAAELAPGLNLQGRAKLFSLLWDKVEAFTELYLKLCEVLQALGRSKEAYCGIEALIPRENSIIDVTLLQDLLQQKGNSSDTLSLVGSNGSTAHIARTLVTALTAEITIPMLEKPDDFFDHTDLLDFPGYRSRLKLDDVRRELQREGTLENLFLRGKVAYLFERYCAEKELTSMLLCIGPGNQEVQDLPRAVQQWIASTHGETPERRALSKSAPALFFVLSKMDMEFEKKKGTPSVSERWTTRFQSSLLDFFGKNDDWPRNWDGKGPFNNVFLLRNPNFRFEAIFAFEGDKEVGIRPDQESYVQEVRQAFLQSPLTKDHVAEPEKVWDAAMQLNDGGISLLRSALRPLCNPSLKREQIAVTLAQSMEKVHAMLGPHFKSDDKEEERKRKDLLARKLAGILAKIIESQRFGEFLRAFQVLDHELHTLYFKAEQERLHEGESGAAVIGERVQAESLLDDLFDDFGDDNPADSEQASENADTTAPLYHDEASRFTDIVLSYWIEQMRALSSNVKAQQYFNFPEKEWGELVHELILAVQRCQVATTMTQAQRRVSGYGNIAREKLVWKQVSLAADTLNAFISWLGFDPRFMDENARSVLVKGKAVTLFAPPKAHSLPFLPEETTPYDRSYYQDWLRAFVQTLQANVQSGQGEHFNREQNALLGAILQQYHMPEIQA